MSVCVSVCLCVCVCICPKTLGQPGDFKNCRIGLKFDTLVPWINTWGCFFHFLKILIFGPRGPFFRSKRAKTLGQPREPKNYWIWLKFGTHVLWANTWGCFFHFLKILIFGPRGPFFRSKRAKTLGQPREPKNYWIWLKFGTHVLWANTWGCFFYFLKILIFGPRGPFNGQKWPKLRRSLGKQNLIRFGWNFEYVFIRQRPNNVFVIFWIFGPGIFMD